MENENMRTADEWQATQGHLSFVSGRLYKAYGPRGRCPFTLPIEISHSDVRNISLIEHYSCGLADWYWCTYEIRHQAALLSLSPPPPRILGYLTLLKGEEIVSLASGEAYPSTSENDHSRLVAKQHAVKTIYGNTFYEAELYYHWYSDAIGSDYCGTHYFQLNKPALVYVEQKGRCDDGRMKYDIHVVFGQTAF